MQDDTLQEAAKLTELAWERTFRRDAAGREAVFRQLVAVLPTSLAEAAAECRSALHPKISIDVQNAGPSVTLRDDAGAVVDCYINPATTGVLRLQYFERGSRDGGGKDLSLVLHCTGLNKYIWTVGKSDNVTLEDLAAFVLRNLFKHAAAVVKRETPTAES